METTDGDGKGTRTTRAIYSQTALAYHSKQLSAKRHYHVRCLQVDHPCDYYGALSDHLIIYIAGRRSPQKHLLTRVQAGSVYIYQWMEVVIGPFAIGG